MWRSCSFKPTYPILAEEMKKAHKKLHEDPAASGFVDKFSSETSRFMTCVENQQRSHAMHAKALLRMASAASTKEQLEDVSRRVDDLARCCLQLDAYVGKNAKLFQQVAGQADARLATCCVNDLHQALGPFKNHPNSTPIVAFSDIYHVIRTGQAKLLLQQSQTASQGTDIEAWVAPTSFVRSTSKYWIKDDKLMTVLLKSVAEAPLLVYGTSGMLTSQPDLLDSLATTQEDELWDRLATSISSIYFDSPDLFLYRERLARGEGAQLLRVRWYGPQPRGTQPVFLELKTHHEKWINSESVKERVAVQEKDMEWFLTTNNVGTHKDAEKVVQAASPSLGKSELRKAVKLLLTMRRLVAKHDLRPCVRLAYKRAAFQLPTSNSLRLTVDRFVSATDESKAPAGAWCLPGPNGPAFTKHIPFAVFEIKLSGSETPQSIQELINSNTVIDAAKFSKFLTAVAAFRSHQLDTLPYWATHPSFAPMFGINKTPSHKVSEKPMIKGGSTGTGDESVTRDESLIYVSTVHSTDRERSHFLMSWLSSRVDKKEKQWQVAPKKPARVEPKSYFANERTFIQWISAALLLVTIAVLLLDFESDLAYARTASKILVGTGIFITVYSVFVYFRRVRMLESGTPYGYVDHIAPVLLSGAILVGFFFLLVTINSIHRTADADYVAVAPSPAFLHEETGKCYKHNSPGLSQLNFEPSDALVVGNWSLLLVPSKTEIVGFPLPHVGLSGDITTDSIPPRRLIDIPGADIEALTMVGDTILALDEARSKSTSTMYALQWTANGELRIVDEWIVPAGDCEGAAFLPGITVGGQGGLYLTDNSNAGNEKVIVFEIPGVPESGDSNDEWIAQLPRVELTPHHALNSRALHQGIDSLSSKIGAMTYFEDVLYILYGNAGIVRAWDMESGNLLSEWALPFVSGGFEKQWEGLALEHIGTSRRKRRLRRLLHHAEGSLLMVHLTLDTPLEVWSFVAQQGEFRGSVVFPDCAAAL